MEEIKLIDQTSKKWLWTYLNTEEEVNEVCEYLSKNNLTIKLKPFRDGCNIYLEGIDLSGNGCCFKGKNLLFHCRYFRKAKAFSETKEFKEWLSKYESFDQVRQYIIERDQRWLKVEKIKKCFS